MTQPYAADGSGTVSTAPAGVFQWTLAIVCALLLAVLFLLLLASAAMRNKGFTAPELYEIIRLIFVYTVGLSAILAYARSFNLKVPGWWRENSISYQLVMLVLSAGLAIVAAKMLLKQGFGPDASSLLGVYEGVSHIPIFLFGCGVAAISARRLWNARRAVKA